MNRTSQANILIVDDRPANLMAIAETLAPLKQNIVKALSGEEALKYLLQQEFAVILLDVQMPGMNGFELAKIIHARPANSYTPILFLTAINRDPAYILEGYSVGAVDYLLKPIVPEILLAKVAIFIELFENKIKLKKQAEELQKANSVLEQKEQQIYRVNQKNQLILNAVGEGIYGVDWQGKTMFLNPAAAKMLGYTLEEVVGKCVCLVLHPQFVSDDEQSSQCPICESLEDGSIHYSNSEEFQRKDGSYFSVEYISSPILENDQIMGAVITFKDVTERRNLEQMKDEFISVASHELRSPLTTILSSIKLLASGVLNQQPETSNKMLDFALLAAERMMILTNDLLDLKRLTTGKFILNKEFSLASDLMEKAVSDVQDFAERSEIILKITPASVRVWADPNALIQTLTNLLSNAIKFSPVKTTVWLSVEVMRSYEKFPLSFQSKISLPCVLFKIEDQGRGIPADKLEIIFERFQQIDVSDSHEKGGSGLGLAICKNIVEQHNGLIWAESILGQGSIFYFVLPLTASDNGSA